MGDRAKAARTFLSWGSVGLPAGIALAAVGQTVAGSFITLVALAILIAGLHTFGRLGPDLGG